MADVEKLSKKQLKALAFKNKKGKKEDRDDKEDKGDGKGENVDAEKVVKAEKVKNAEKSADSKASNKKAKKAKENVEGSKEEAKTQSKSSSKRKRDNDSETKKPRFILFVGNLPYDIDMSQLEAHFKAVAPITVRPRKGFAFIEFEGDDASQRLKVALRLHHSILKNRKINVELTAGGGGNSQNRMQKIQDKRIKLQDENRERIQEEAEKAEKAEKAARAAEKKANKTQEPAKPKLGAEGIHPSRAKLMG